MPEGLLGTPFIVTVGIVSVGALVGIGIWVGRINANLEHLASDVTAHRSKLKDFMREIRDDIKKILRALPPPQTAVSASPTPLSEFGERVAAGVDALDWAAQTAKSILADKELQELEPFQIEAFCAIYLEKESRKKGIVQDKVQKAIYEFGVDLDRALPVLRIPLREALLIRRASLTS